ncbi:MAG: DGQHR domain-containing protein [Flavobacteriaceae bacterium]|nr:DGQHR domain-containing protein [Flavobacteriaceae bacterium]
MIEIGENFTNSANLLRKDLKRRQSQVDKHKVIENRIWNLFKTLGFDYMNIDGECSVKYGGQKTLQAKKIDVIAESEDVRVFVECTTQKTNTQKIKIWTSEVVQIRKYHRKEKLNEKKNISFVYCSNVSLSETDYKILNENGIKYLNNSICEYFFELAKQYKKLGYYQFLGYLCENKTHKGLEKNALKVPAIKTKYGSRNDCYLFGINPSKIIPLSTVPHRKKSFSETKELNFQRIVKKSKISKIKKFISLKRGVFPTNIVLSINSRVKFERQNTIGNIQYGNIQLPNKYQSLSIIDGQHRLFAYDNLPEADKDLIFVIAFERMDLEKQVQTFIDINQNQTNVSSSLLWDLYPEILDEGDEKRSISLLAKQLNSDSSSSLYGHIKYDSADYSKNKPKITLESVCTSMKKENIIDLCKVQVQPPSENYDYPFMLISLWFDIISKLDEEHWNRKEQTFNFYLSNQAFGAFSKLLREIIQEERNVLFTKSKCEVSAKLTEYITPIIEKVKTLKKKEEITAFKKVGEGGKLELFKDLVRLIQKDKVTFCENLFKSEGKDKIDKYLKQLEENAEGNDIEVKEAYFTDVKRLKSTRVHEKNKRETLDKILHSLIGFANSSKGGTLLIGIEDKTWKVVGIENYDLKNRDYDKLKHELDQEFKKIKGLNQIPLINRFYHNENKSILEIKVSPLPKERFEQKQLVGINGDCYKRSNSSSVKIDGPEIGNYCNYILSNW